MVNIGNLKVVVRQLVPMFFVVSATGFSLLVIVAASESYIWEVDPVFSFRLFATGFPVPAQSEFGLYAASVTKRDELEPSAFGDRLAVSSTLNSSMVSIAPPHVPLLQISLPASASSKRFSNCYLDWNWCKRTSENSGCWTNGEDDSTHRGCQFIWFGFWAHNWFCQTASQARLLGSGHVSHRRTSALNDHLDHCFIFFKMYNWATNWKSSALVTTWSTLDNSSTSQLLVLFGMVLWLVLQISLHARLLGTWSSTSSIWQWSLTARWVVFEECNTFITASPRSRAGDFIHSQTSIQRNNF